MFTGLDKAVLQSMYFLNNLICKSVFFMYRRTECNLQSSHQLSRQEVEDLLRKGAYGIEFLFFKLHKHLLGAIMDEDNEDAKFGEEDIDTILERRAQTIKLEVCLIKHF